MKSMVALVLAASVVLNGSACAVEVLDLAGTWAFAFGQKGAERPGAFTDTIALPGTTETNRKGPENPEQRLLGLTRLYRFEGPAWYQREVTIPATWAGKRVTLLLERSKFAQVWLDDRLCGESPILCTPQEYDLGAVAPGRHRLTVLVDNSRRPVKCEMHQMSDNTQGNWNGIIGRLELRATDAVWIEDLQIYPDVAGDSARVVARVGNVSTQLANGTLTMQLFEAGACTTALSRAALMLFAAAPGGATLETQFKLPNAPQWDEFTPHLLRLTADLQMGPAGDAREVLFGFHNFKTLGTQFNVNGRTTFLRGKHDGCVFPLTGHPPMEVEGWLKYLRICQDYGINHIRFHTWTPPDAAFAAADQLGMYLQPELPFWGKYDEAAVAALRPEAERILRAYGNHPSFAMLSLGNECGGSRAVLSNLVAELRHRDPRRLYAQGSNNFLGDPQLAGGDDYWTTFRTRQGAAGNVRGSFATVDGGNGIAQIGLPGTLGDYTGAIAGLPVPVIGHEVGQFEAFPNFDEIQNYTGVFRARNFEKFRADLAAAGMAGQAHDFFRASARLAALGYREEIEAALRTPGFGGFQLLDLQDFPGQGTALVGILDAFMHSKGAISPDDWRQFCAPVVLLARFPRYTWTAGETFSAAVQVAHYGAQDFADATLAWELLNSHGRSLAGGRIAAGWIKQGGLRPLGEISAPLAGVKAPDQLTLVLRLGGTKIGNRYPLWVYPPSAPAQPPAGVTLARGCDAAARAALARGGRVVLVPTDDWLENSVEGGFMTDFWCWPMFHNRPGTMGLLCNEQHPALAGFPTAMHSDWQWFHIASAARPLILDALPKDFRPIVQVVDNFARLHRLGLVFETKVGPGRLLVCACDLLKLDKQPEARQLLNCLLTYAAYDRFQPAQEISAQALRDLFPHTIPLGTHATASSSESAERGPAQALDGDRQTRWCASSITLPQWWRVDLTTPRRITGLEIRWEQERSGYGYIVEGSTDGVTWFQLSDQRKNNVRGLHRLTFPAVTVRHLRLVISHLPQGRWASICEIKAIGTDEE